MEKICCGSAPAFTFLNTEIHSDMTRKTSSIAQTGHMHKWICYSKSHVWWNCFSQIRGRRVNHCDCSQTGGFSQDMLRLGSYHSSPERPNTQIRTRWALSMSSGWKGISWHEKCLFSGSNHTGPHMIKALWQSSKFLVVCLCGEKKEEKSPQGQGFSTQQCLLK